MTTLTLQKHNLRKCTRPNKSLASALNLYKATEGVATSNNSSYSKTQRYSVLK